MFAALGSLETLPSQCDRHADSEVERLPRLTFCDVIGALGAEAQLQINSTSRFESLALRCINVYSDSGILPSDTASQISIRSSAEGGSPSRRSRGFHAQRSRVWRRSTTLVRLTSAMWTPVVAEVLGVVELGTNCIPRKTKANKIEVSFASVRMRLR